MCFSAGASFVASATLGTIGAATVIKTRKKKLLPLALIPIIFAVQQFIEGWLWISLMGSQSYLLLLTGAFLFFAFLWWPIYVPFTIYWLETKPHRRKIIAVLAGLGVLVGTILYAGFLYHPEPAEIVNRCIYYPTETPYETFLTYLYILATVGVGIFSSRQVIRVFCLLIGVFALIAWLVFTLNFTSVWCFFAALVSMILYWYLPKK